MTVVGFHPFPQRGSHPSKNSPRR